MTRTAKLVCVTFGLILPTAVSAGELAPLQTGTFNLRDHTASVYYTARDGNFEVVTTIAPDSGQGAPARYTTQLAPGQIATVSVGSFGTGEPPTSLKLERDGDTLSVDIVPEQLASR
jgi:hypothetical protein